MRSALLDDMLILNLYKAMLKDTLLLAEQSVASRVFLSLTDTEKIEASNLFEIDYFEKQKSTISKLERSFHKQPEGDFGKRMESAIEWIRGKRIEKIVILGADSPHLQVSVINDSFANINESTVSIGPAESAGIYLIGVHRSQKLDGIKEVFKSPELLRIVDLFEEYKIDLQPNLQDLDVANDLISFIIHCKLIMKINKNQSNRQLNFPALTYDVIKKIGLEVNGGGNNRELKLIKREK